MIAIFDIQVGVQRCISSELNYVTVSWALGHILSFKDVQLKIARASDNDIYAQLIESTDVDVQLACVWALANLHHEVDNVTNLVTIQI